MTPKQITINSLEELPQAAQWLNEQITISGKEIVALYGAMGVGKTTLIAEFCRQRGVLSGISSPTFSIVNIYEVANVQKIYHFDCYRFESETEAMEIGIFDYFDSGELCFVEWPERIEGILQRCDVLKIKISAPSLQNPSQRVFELLVEE